MEIINKSERKILIINLIREIKVQMSVMMNPPGSHMEKRIRKRVPYLPFFAYKKIVTLHYPNNSWRCTATVWPKRG
jgi:hypothetical protein